MGVIHFISFCLISYSVGRFISNLFAVKDESLQRKQVTLNKNFAYFTNGHKIIYPHHIYYRQLLEIDKRNDINEDVIKHAASNLLSKKHCDSMITEVADIEAAKLYLLDNWSYWVMQN